ncbi:MAG: SusC/RagA family TonB-linked outer membrane protein [Lewinellaceae bacterium]|nr:SusC/RagA family TonB-linked outer membrane protein [Lewinellaceae bacterium]
MALLFLLAGFTLQAQFTVTGTVLEEGTGSPLAGVNIVEAGNPSNGAISDYNGRFSLETSSNNATLIASYVGYVETRISLEGKSEVAIVMSAGLSLDEVVVTALGIERDKKALGYAVQNVSGDDLSSVRSPNLINNLAGRLAGVQVTGASNGIASSSRIVIRGESSLNINNNSPLIVVDGIPVNNNIYGVGSSSTDQSDMPTDYGNGAAEINPEDIESVNVLRGAAASALYGSRAANGVVVITTRRGQARKGLGVQLSSSTMFSSPLVLPKQQTQYGGGWGLEYYADYGTNFGPSLVEGRAIVQDGSPGFDAGQAEPFVYRYKLEDYFQTGVSSNNQVSITGGNDKGDFRLSYANAYNTGIVPNTDLKRNNFNFNTSYRPNDDWTVNLSATYIKSNSDNLPVSGYGGQGLMYAILWNYANVDVDWLRNYWYEEDRVQRNIFTWADNPFLIINEHINAFDKDRLFGQISTTYNITPALSLMLRIGTDYSDEFRMSRRPMGSVYHRNGMYREQNIGFRETNADALLSYTRRFGDFSTKISAGGNRFDQTVSESFLEGQGLAIPGIYTPGNINVTPSLYRYDGQKRVNSAYAFANIGFRDFVYLDLTARNDWSSTLPTSDNSYFYPSLSLSIIPTELINMGAAMDYLKARFNIARVGKDTDPYQLFKAYRFATLPNSLTNPNQLPNENLKPEQTDSWEAGLEAYFLKGRLSADITYYHTASTNQIISFAVSGASGFQSVFANAGKITNKGVELVLSGSPIRTKNFEWRLGANFTANRSEVVELYAGLESYIIAQGPDGVTVEARPGGRMGDIYGNTYVHAPDGQIIYNTNGLPLLGPREKIGNYNPDWMLGLSTGFSFKGFNLNGLFDIRQGGIIYSYTHAIGNESGILASSLPGRVDGIVGEGVVQNADGSYSPNTTVVDAETWYYGGVYPRENAEANSFDASYIKLRELSLGYSLPTALANKLGLSGLSVALVGNNLALWTDVPDIDPESQALNGGTLVPGFEVTQLPSTKAVGFKINLNF